MSKTIHTLLILLLLSFNPNISVGQTNSSIEALKEQLLSLPANKEKVDLLNKIGAELKEIDLEIAKTYNRQALSLAEQLNYQLGIGKAKRNLGSIASKVGEKKEALFLYEEALAIAQQNQFTFLEARALLNLGVYWRKTYKISKSLTYLNNALDSFTALEDKYWVIECYYELAWTLHDADKNEQSEYYFKLALSQSEQINDPLLTTKTLFGLAMFHIKNRTNLYSASQYLERAMKIARELNNELQIGYLNRGLGYLYSTLQKKKEAKSYYLASIESYKSSNDYYAICMVYLSLGTIAVEEKDYDKYLEYQKEVLAIVDKVNRKEQVLAYMYIVLGHIYRERDKDFTKALEQYFLVLENASKVPLNTLIIKSRVYLGMTYFELGDYKEAERWFVKNLDDPNLVLSDKTNIYEHLAKIYNKLGQKEPALKYYKEFINYQDSLHQEELSVQITNLEVRENYDKEIARIKQEQIIEQERSKTKMTILLAGMALLFMSIIAFLAINNIKRTAQKKQLLGLAKLRKEVISNVSHDLRTPISVMQGYAETLLMKKDSLNPVDREKYINIILNSSDRLSKLITQLFEFSKLEAEQVALQKEAFTINELLKNAAEEYQMLAKQKGLKVEISCPSNDLVVYADKFLIQRVVQNLMDNALKFAAENGTVKLCLEPQHKAVKIAVTDDGIGIEKEKQAVIFNRHHKMENSKGAGLGLAIVKKILELHESSIALESELGKGTSFFFSLPIHE